ncbi:MAG: hypothetical protein MK085_07585 [Phycisphaerales bacterium]|nr:hypothetical protein [Phycisphaerales bacterium]
MKSAPRMQRTRTGGVGQVILWLARPRGVGQVLLWLAAMCMVSCMVGFVLLTLPSTRSFMATLRKQAEAGDYTEFLAPGSAGIQLETGMIFVNYLTDREFEGVRYQVPDSLAFNLVIENSRGIPIPIQTDPGQSARLPTDDDGLQRKAVLVAIAEIPEDDTYTLAITLPGNTANKAVAQIITLTEKQKDETAKVMVYLGMVVCGGGGAVFLGVLGGGVLWINRQPRTLMTEINAGN